MINLKLITHEINVFFINFLKVRRSVLGFSDKFGQISVCIFVSTFNHDSKFEIQYTILKKNSYSNKNNVLMGPYSVVGKYSAE